MEAQYVRESAQSQNVSPEVRAALANSRLGSGLMAARGTFLTGLNTYLLKLGPEKPPRTFIQSIGGLPRRFLPSRRGCGSRTWRRC